MITGIVKHDGNTRNFYSYVQPRASARLKLARAHKSQEKQYIKEAPGAGGEISDIPFATAWKEGDKQSFD